MKMFKTGLGIALLSLTPSVVLASGSTGDYGGSSYDRPAKTIDPVYERGKAIFTGRSQEYRKYAFCIRDNSSSEPQKIKRKNIKAYKNSTYDAVAGELVKCDEPNKAITDVVSRDDVSFLVYYIDKRYKLELSQ